MNSESYTGARDGLFKQVRDLVQILVGQNDLIDMDRSNAPPWMGRVFGFYQERLQRNIGAAGRNINQGLAFLELYAEHLDQFAWFARRDPEISSFAEANLLKASLNDFFRTYDDDIKKEKSSADYSSDKQAIDKTLTLKNGQKVSWIGAGGEEENPPGREMTPDLRTPEEIEQDERAIRERERQIWHLRLMRSRDRQQGIAYPLSYPEELRADQIQRLERLQRQYGDEGQDMERPQGRPHGHGRSRGRSL